MVGCYWPNPLAQSFITGVHRRYFHNCSVDRQQWQDPPDEILIPLIVVPILLTLAMTGLVVWRSKRAAQVVWGPGESEGPRPERWKKVPPGLGEPVDAASAAPRPCLGGRGLVKENVLWLELVCQAQLPLLRPRCPRPGWAFGVPRSP